MWDNVGAKYRESVEDNWVFFVRLQELSDHLHWAVVVNRQDVDPVQWLGTELHP